MFWFPFAPRLRGLPRPFLPRRPFLLGSAPGRLPCSRLRPCSAAGGALLVSFFAFPPVVRSVFCPRLRSPPFFRPSLAAPCCPSPSALSAVCLLRGRWPSPPLLSLPSLVFALRSRCGRLVSLVRSLFWFLVSRLALRSRIVRRVFLGVVVGAGSPFSPSFGAPLCARSPLALGPAPFRGSSRPPRVAASPFFACVGFSSPFLAFLASCSLSVRSLRVFALPPSRPLLAVFASPSWRLCACFARPLGPSPVLSWSCRSLVAVASVCFLSAAPPVFSVAFLWLWFCPALSAVRLGPLGPRLCFFVFPPGCRYPPVVPRAPLLPALPGASFFPSVGPSLPPPRFELRLVGGVRRVALPPSAPFWASASSRGPSLAACLCSLRLLLAVPRSLLPPLSSPAPFARVCPLSLARPRLALPFPLPSLVPPPRPRPLPSRLPGCALLLARLPCPARPGALLFVCPAARGLLRVLCPSSRLPPLPFGCSPPASPLLLPGRFFPPSSPLFPWVPFPPPSCFPPFRFGGALFCFSPSRVPASFRPFPPWASFSFPFAPARLSAPPSRSSPSPFPPPGCLPSRFPPSPSSRVASAVRPLLSPRPLPARPLPRFRPFRFPLPLFPPAGLLPPPFSVFPVCLLLLLPAFRGLLWVPSSLPVRGGPASCPRWLVLIGLGAGGSGFSLCPPLVVALAVGCSVRRFSLSLWCPWRLRARSLCGGLPLARGRPDFGVAAPAPDRSWPAPLLRPRPFFVSFALSPPVFPASAPPGPPPSRARALSPPPLSCAFRVLLRRPSPPLLRPLGPLSRRALVVSSALPSACSLPRAPGPLPPVALPSGPVVPRSLRPAARFSDPPGAVALSGAPSCLTSPSVPPSPPTPLCCRLLLVPLPRLVLSFALLSPCPSPSSRLLRRCPSRAPCSLVCSPPLLLSPSTLLSPSPPAPGPLFCVPGARASLLVRLRRPSGCPPPAPPLCAGFPLPPPLCPPSVRPAPRPLVISRPGSSPGPAFFCPVLSRCSPPPLSSALSSSSRSLAPLLSASSPPPLPVRLPPPHLPAPLPVLPGLPPLVPLGPPSYSAFSCSPLGPFSPPPLPRGSLFPLHCPSSFPLFLSALVRVRPAVFFCRCPPPVSSVLCRRRPPTAPSLSPAPSLPPSPRPPPSCFSPPPFRPRTPPPPSLVCPLVVAFAVLREPSFFVRVPCPPPRSLPVSASPPAPPPRWSALLSRRPCPAAYSPATPRLPACAGPLACRYAPPALAASVAVPPLPFILRGRPPSPLPALHPRSPAPFSPRSPPALRSAATAPAGLSHPPAALLPLAASPRGPSARSVLPALASPAWLLLSSPLPRASSASSPEPPPPSYGDLFFGSGLLRPPPRRPSHPRPAPPSRLLSPCTVAYRRISAVLLFVFLLLLLAFHHFWGVVSTAFVHGSLPFSPSPRPLGGTPSLSYFRLLSISPGAAAPFPFCLRVLLSAPSAVAFRVMPSALALPVVRFDPPCVSPPPAAPRARHPCRLLSVIVFP